MGRPEEISWGAFYRTYVPAAVRFAAGLTGEAAVAEDLVAEAFGGLFERVRAGALRFESRAHARNYFFRAVRNQAVSTARRRARRPKPEALGSNVESLPELEPSGSGAGERDEELERVRAAVAELPEPERVALERRYLSGESYREMSATLAAPISTLQGRVQGALEKIRRKIGKEGGEA